jgi:hypothetical protein
MADRNRAAMRIQARPVYAQAALTGYHLRRKRLIQLNQVYLFQAQAQPA